jgi:hypothetical protein
MYPYTRELITHLTTQFPHRGSTTEHEKDAAIYLKDEFEASGYKPEVQEFKSSISAYLQVLFFAILQLIAITIALLFEQLVFLSIAIILFSTISILLDAAFIKGPLYLVIPKRKSQNIIAKLPSAQIEKQTLVIMGHVDSHRTPLLFSSANWIKIFKSLVPLALLMSLLAIISIISVAFGYSEGKYLLIVSGIFFVLFSILMIQAHFSPFTTGANDNASGAATTVALAQFLKDNPLKNTTIYFVVSGCEEVGAYGASAFAKKYSKIIPKALWLSIDGIGAINSVPAILKEETFLLKYKSDPELLEIAQKTINEVPEAGSFLKPTYQGAYTDSSPGAKYGFRVITIVGVEHDGTLPSWHTMEDNLENFDWKTLEKSLPLIEKLVVNIDVDLVE